jgi:hypothetical protein
VEDLSLHILDIAENAVRAGAKTIEIAITKDEGRDVLVIGIKDDGGGMDAETLARVRDPFFTTKGKKTGLGIPLLAQAAEQTGGGVKIESAPGSGTRVEALFGLSHVDRPAIGNTADTLLALIAGHPELDIAYVEREGDRMFRFDTKELRRELEDVPVNDPGALEAVRGLLRKEIRLDR